jgi:hypothetical protein
MRWRNRTGNVDILGLQSKINEIVGFLEANCTQSQGVSIARSVAARMQRRQAPVAT